MADFELCFYMGRLGLFVFGIVLNVWTFFVKVYTKVLENQLIVLFEEDWFVVYNDAKLFFYLGWNV